jgi:hypothetical protein
MFKEGNTKKESPAQIDLYATSGALYDFVHCKGYAIGSIILYLSTVYVCTMYVCMYVCMG